MFVRALSLCIVAGLAVGCTTEEATPSTTTPVSSSQSSSTPTPEPGGTGGGAIESASWELQADSLTLATPVPGTIADATFADGELSGSSGCNRYRATYTIDGENLEVSDLVSTKLDCLSTLEALEQAFQAVLAQAATFGVQDDSLAIADAGGVVVLRFQRVENVELTGHYWAVTGYAGAGGELVTSLPTTELTMRFDESGRISGTTECNSYGGRFTLDGADMAIENLAATTQLCDGSLMAQEKAFRSVLPAVTSYAIREDQLELRGADGRLLVALRPDVTPGVSDGE